MANLLGQNIGTNYKGILNLNTLNSNLSGTLQAVTDGDGNASPLQLSTTQMRVLANQGFSQNWYNSGGTANNRSVWVYQTGASWSLYSRSDANDAGEEFINMTAVSSNVQSLTLGKTASPLILSTQLATLASSNLAVGHTSASARLHVKGDGTAPIQIWDAGGAGTEVARMSNTGAFVLGTTSPNASAILQADSTTQGFLPPRMTSTQINAITSPAEGLVVFNTDITHLCIFANSSWHRLVHIAM